MMIQCPMQVIYAGVYNKIFFCLDYISDFTINDSKIYFFSNLYYFYLF